MSKAVLPSPPEQEIINTFLHDSTGLFIKGSRFFRHGGGLGFKVEYIDLKGFTQTKSLIGPDTTDFQEMVVNMSDWLEYVSYGERRVATVQ